ncbi:uncharacterized protein LOC126686735 isoform X3 [Mercurialis annua]|uniref:uncharacterized protein LOC126686735 isoform X3 n=1 Tax=Mercurialis annua TaxID=3986 RepID=UPI0021609FF5|nr:uncharacterized protein LOC126686735 isoform X3 [Mercurialis annua]
MPLKPVFYPKDGVFTTLHLFKLTLARLNVGYVMRLIISLTLPKTLEFPSLKNLHLVRFRLDDFDASFFSSCPNLETLKLEDVWFEVIGSFSVCALNLRTFEFESLESDFDWNYEFVIVAPKLRKFKFDGYPPFFCSTKNLCSPDQIEIHLPSDLELLYSTDELKQRLALEVLQMLKAFHTAESITLFVNVLQVLSYISPPLNEHPLESLNLKYLQLLKGKSSWKVKIPSSIFNFFLKNSPLLEIC